VYKILEKNTPKNKYIIYIYRNNWQNDDDDISDILFYTVQSKEIEINIKDYNHIRIHS